MPSTTYVVCKLMSEKAAVAIYLAGCFDNLTHIFFTLHCGVFIIVQNNEINYEVESTESAPKIKPLKPFLPIKSYLSSNFLFGRSAKLSL